MNFLIGDPHCTHYVLWRSCKLFQVRLTNLPLVSLHCSLHRCISRVHRVHKRRGIPGPCCTHLDNVSTHAIPSDFSPGNSLRVLAKTESMQLGENSLVQSFWNVLHRFGCDKIYFQNDRILFSSKSVLNLIYYITSIWYTEVCPLRNQKK